MAELRSKASLRENRTTSTPGVSTAMRWLALFGLLLGGLLPASAGAELFPYWDLDPITQWLPSTGIQPVHMLMLALLSVLSAGLAFAARSAAGQPVSWGLAALAGIGSLGVLIHGSFDHTLHGDGAGAEDGLEHLVQAAPWIAMIWGWVGLSQLTSDARTRSTVLAVLAGFVVALLSKAALQVFIEHPTTIAEFERTKAATFASKGWPPDSPAALAYTRRLLQPEASGWFGLSNVYATFVGAGAAGLIAATAALVVRSRRITRSICIGVLVGACAIAALLMSQSKGGIGAAGIGLGLCAGVGLFKASRFGQQHPGLERKITIWIGPTVIAGILGLVAMRGFLGTEIGEKSLLFRSFYAVGSFRIWGAHPIFGVGPDGFQDAYAAAKIPIATETVQSPHSVLLDWIATLGIFGLAWAGLLLWQSTKLLKPLEDSHRDTGPDSAATEPNGIDRDTVRFVVLLIAAIGLAATGFERALATPMFAAARVVGLGAWIAASVGLLSVFQDRKAVRWFGLASGLAIIAHVQIEVTPIWVNAAPLLGIWLGTVTSPGHARQQHDDAEGQRNTSMRARVGPIGVVTCSLAISIWTVALPIARTSQWQSALAEAAKTIRPAGELRADFETVAAARDRAGLERLAQRLSQQLGRGVPAQPEAVADAVTAVRLALTERTIEPLSQAVQARPAHQGTLASYRRTMLSLAAETPKPALRASLIRLITDIDHPAFIRPRSVGLWDGAAVAAERTAALYSFDDAAATPTNEMSDRARKQFEVAIDCWLAVDEKSPYAIRPAVRLMDLYERLGASAESRAWATKALDRDALSDLDPISGLTDAERSRVKQVLGRD